MKKVFICAGIRSDSKEEFVKNIELYKKYCKYVSHLGYMPIAPYLYYTQFLNNEDSKESLLCNEINYEFLSECDEVWVFVNDMHVSKGMQNEISFAHEKCMFIKYVNDLTIED